MDEMPKVVEKAALEKEDKVKEKERAKDKTHSTNTVKEA